MTKKHIVSSGASYGLAFGVVMFLVGLALAYRTDMGFSGIFMYLNAPAFALIARLIPLHLAIQRATMPTKMFGHRRHTQFLPPHRGNLKSFLRA